MSVKTLELLDFIATEATHDNFYNMTDLMDPNKGGKDLKELIDELGKKCSLEETQTPTTTLNVPFNNAPTELPSDVFKTSYFANNKGISEHEMDEVLLGDTRKSLCSDQKYIKQWHTTQVPSIDFNTMKVSDQDADIQHFTDITAVPDDTTTINDMFSQVVKVNGKKDIYFVCDSASELIGKFSTTPYFPDDINVHVMISSATLADPSSKITLLQKHPRKKPKIGDKYIHTYDVPINLEKCDKFGLLDFDISHTLIGTNPDYQVEEIFEYSETGQATPTKPPPPPYSSYTLHPYPSRRSLNPANVQTSKKQIQCEIGKGFLNHKKCNNKDGKPAKAPFNMDMIRGLRIAQYKRMGDHQQIRFIRWLWEGNFMADQILYHLHPNSVQITKTAFQSAVVQNSVKNSILSSFRSPNPTNCFFVTGDYPAFEYAIFHRINAIIKTSSSNCSKKGLLMVRFN